MPELNMEAKISVKNLAGWDVGFARKETIGDVTIPADGTFRLSRSEVIAQVQYGNKLFNGIDGRGSHATVYIEDKDTRVELEFETETSEQQIITENVVKKMFETKSMKSFEKSVDENIVTRAEKYAFIKLIKKLKLNDFDKIRYAEKYTGYKVENIS